MSSVTASCGGSACSLSYELFVDGTAVPRARYTVSAASGPLASAVVITGFRDAVPAGAHTVELRSASTGAPTSVTDNGAQVQALLAGS